MSEERTEWKEREEKRKRKKEEYKCGWKQGGIVFKDYERERKENVERK